MERSGVDGRHREDIYCSRKRHEPAGVLLPPTLGQRTDGEPSGPGARNMSKSQDTKKDTKKKPSKTMKEKRADKKAKQASR
jgi:hypothetical protein